MLARWCKEEEKRGGRVVFVDPRRTESADKVGEHFFIRPGTDAYLLMGLLHVIGHEHALDTAAFRAVADGADTFVQTAAVWTPERVATITGIDAASIRDLARSYARAKGAALYMSTGVNMGPFGSIAYWLLQGLNLLTGNLDRAGGLLVPRGAFDTFALAKALGLGAFDAHRTLQGGWHRVAATSSWVRMVGCGSSVRAFGPWRQGDDLRGVAQAVLSSGYWSLRGSNASRPLGRDSHLPPG